MFLLFLSFMLGMSLLLPWNAFLKSLPYMMTRVPESWRDTAPLWYTLTFTLTNCLVLIGFTLSDLDSRIIRKVYGVDVEQTERIVSGRLYSGLIGCGLVLLLACSVPLIDLCRSSPTPPSPANLILFWGLFLCTGWLMSLLQRSVYPLMSLLPGRKEKLVPAMLTGQAAAGITASIGSFLFASKNEDGAALMALIYFTCSIAALILTASLYKCHQLRSVHQPLVEKEETTAVEMFSIKIIKETVKLISPWPQLLALNFITTLTIFPGLLTSSARSLSPSRQPYFIPLTFLTFDVFDLIGKVMPSIWSKGFSYKSRAAKIFPVARVLFIPLFLLLPNFSLLKRETTHQTDALYFILLAGMAWTSGWGNAICLINGPAKANEESRKGSVSNDLNDKIGGLMGLSITIGLVGGSFMSFVLKKIIFK